MAHREPVRLEAGPLLAAAAALLLLVSLFLDWYGRPDAPEAAVTAWTAFEVHDLLLAAIGLVALARAASALGAITPRGPQVPLWALGLAALVIVGSQLVNPPPGAIDATREIGAWIALGASLLLVGAGLINRVRVSIVSDTDAGKAARAPEPRPAETPPAEDPAARATSVFDSQAPETSETQPLRPEEWGKRRQR
jgi:hypothetical protein